MLTCTFQAYIQYLWEYLNAHNLLNTYFQRLNREAAAKNGGKRVLSIIRSDKENPSDNALTLGMTKTKHSLFSYDN